MPLVRRTGVNKISTEDQHSQYMTQDETILVSDPWLGLEKVVGFRPECTTFDITRAAFFHDRTCQCDNILHVLYDDSEGRVPAMIENSGMLGI